MKELGQSLDQRDLDRMISEVDLDQSGSIEFPEFLVMIMKKIQESI